MKSEDERIFKNDTNKQLVHPGLVQIVQALARYAADKDFDAAVQAAKAKRGSPAAKPSSSERRPARGKRSTKSR